MGAESKAYFSVPNSVIASLLDPLHSSPVEIDIGCRFYWDHLHPEIMGLSLAAMNLLYK